VTLPWKILAGILALAAALAYGDHHGRKVERTTWQAKVEQTRAEASEEARRIERQRQEDADAATQKQIDDLGRINDGLVADIDRLRNRPPRVIRVPGDTITTCESATGAELSGPDARFLAGLAARADECRATLNAYYSWADGLSQGR
jgi:hypothetical protein